MSWKIWVAQVLKQFEPLRVSSSRSLSLKNCILINATIIIKGGYRRAEKSLKVLMMKKAAKLDLAKPGAGQKQGRSGPAAKQEQGSSRSRGGVWQELS